MEKELKIDSVSIKSDVLIKEKLWVIIPVVLLVGLLSTLIYKHHAEFSIDGLVSGFDQIF